MNDDGSVRGLAEDLQTFSQRQDTDAYENWLIQRLLNDIGKDCAPALAVSFPKIDGLQICRLDLTRAPRPVYLKSGNDEIFYIRAGNTKKRLSTRETVDYVKRHWD